MAESADYKIRETIHNSPSRETIAYIIREKKMGFDISQDLALEMADAILAAWQRS